jgi:putative CocE/NonD family hydrolase
LLIAGVWAHARVFVGAVSLAALVAMAALLWRAGSLAPQFLTEIMAVIGVLAAWALLAATAVFARRKFRWGLVLVIPLAALLMLDTASRAARLLDPVQLSSRYLRMRDGILIATDLYLPRGPASARLPTIVEQTRYHRSMAYRWPASLILDRPRPDIARFVGAGYAYVFVDARGSGASFGSRQQEWLPDEVADGGEVVDWIVRQPWSSGKVGATGISYNCTAAELLASTGRPALRAIAPRFCMLDVYADIAFPGGILQDWFGKRWGGFNAALDRNELGHYLGGAPGLLLAGVRPVDADGNRALLRRAIADHAANYDVATFSAGNTYRDDRGSTNRTLDDFSTFSKAGAIRASGVPIFLWSGWYDAANQRAAIAKFLTYGNPGSKLIIGAWDHGARQNISPFNQQKALFDQTGELIRFFDHHLKGVANGFERTPAVRYFVMGAERWKGAGAWPVPAVPATFYLGPQQSLRAAPPGDDAAPDTYRVDPAAGSGMTSRWESAVNIKQETIGYPDRAAQDRHLIAYVSAPLNSAMEVTGHPVLTLYLASSATDADVFAYLEDVGPDGRITYVTEGWLKARHRKELPQEQAPYWMDGPHHSFRRADASPLVPGEPAQLRFDLLPTSYLFRAGHRIRLSIAGADKDHSPLPPNASWQLFHDAKRPQSSCCRRPSTERVAGADRIRAGGLGIRTGSARRPPRSGCRRRRHALSCGCCRCPTRWRAGWASPCRRRPS